MKVLLVFCILILMQSATWAKLLIADTIGQEKIVRNLAFNLKPARNIEIKPAKLADALRNLRQGKINLVLSSYKLDSKQRRKLKVNCYRYALAAVILVVNSRSEIVNISKKNLQKVLSGEIVTWKPLGGEAYSINLAMAKDDQPGMRALYQKVLKQSAIKARSLTVSNAQGVAILAAMKPGVLGVCGFVNLPLAAKTLSFDGVMPSMENIRSGKYKAITECWVWISDKAEHKKSLDYKAILEFIALLRSTKTIKFIESCGFLSNAK